VVLVVRLVVVIVMARTYAENLAGVKRIWSKIGVNAVDQDAPDTHKPP